jgi:hydrogenase/urease accessory protein HupE
MEKKYIFFNNPVTLVILIIGLFAMVAGVAFLANKFRGYDFAVGFYIAVISIITVSAAYSAENRQIDRNAVEDRVQETDHD